MIEMTKTNNGTLKATTSFFNHPVDAESKYGSALIRETKTIKTTKGAGKDKFTKETESSCNVLNFIYEADQEQFEKDYKVVGKSGNTTVFKKIGE